MPRFDTTQILVLAAVVVGCAAAGFVWLWNRRVRGLRALAAYMRGKGMDVEILEAGLVDVPRHGPMLAVSLLPSDGAFSCGIKAIEDNVGVK